MDKPKIGRSVDDLDAIIARDVMVPMRDGVRLATDVYLPARGVDPLAGSFRHYWSAPRITRVSQTLSRRASISPGVATRSSFRIAVAATRPKGEFYFLAQEAEDGYDTMVWLKSSHGATGASEPSAPRISPGCRTRWRRSTLPTGRDVRQRGWGQCTHQFGAAQRRVRNALHGLGLPRAGDWHTGRRSEPLPVPCGEVQFRDWLKRLPLKPGMSPLALVPMHERWVFDIWTHGDYDEYWKQPGFDFEEHFENHSDVPILFSGAWYDSYTRSTLENYVRFSQGKRGPIRLMMGPWTHGGDKVDLTWSGDVEFGAEASIAGNLAERRQRPSSVATSTTG